MLAWTIYISFIGVAILMLLPKGNARAARTVALLTAFFGFTCAMTGVLQAKGGSEIEIVAKIPAGPEYGDLRLNPIWDPLRGDPRFDKIVASLAPK